MVELDIAHSFKYIMGAIVIYEGSKPKIQIQSTLQDCTGDSSAHEAEVRLAQPEDYTKLNDQTMTPPC